MIATDKRKAIFLLHQEGMSAREIARRLGVDRDTVRQIIQQEGATPHPVRVDKWQIDPELLRRLYTQCEGWIQRVHEKLVEEEGIAVKYSTLTKRLRELGISTPARERCDRVPDVPGAEMQHDTSVYWLRLGEQRVKVIASLMYLRYSKRRYLRFYRWFNRFRMKCFFYEALTYWGYAARRCIIDNTNLARLRGAGPTAIIVPEMERFGQQFAFEFRCHKIGHPNRKESVAYCASYVLSKTKVELASIECAVEWFGPRRRLGVHRDIPFCRSRGPLEAAPADANSPRGWVWSR